MRAGRAAAAATWAPATATQAVGKPQAVGKQQPGRRGALAEAPDHGSAGLLAVWVAVLLLMAGSSATVWGAALAARHRAARTADLAALAAAAAAVHSAGDPCTAARRVMTTVRADLASCAVLPDGSVLVVVALSWLPGDSGPWGALRLPPARARARAGPP